MRKIVSAYIILGFTTFNSLGQSHREAPGSLIDVNGYRLHMIIEGEEGTPVVMFHGAGDIALHWGLVLPGVAQFAKAIAVDQAGEGWSGHGHGIHMWQQA